MQSSAQTFAGGREVRPVPPAKWGRAESRTVRPAEGPVKWRKRLARVGSEPGPPGGAGRPARYRTKAVYPGGERRDR